MRTGTTANWSAAGVAAIDDLERDPYAKVTVGWEVWYNVMNYGATGDGVTDDTAAIQTVLDLLVDGDTVYFPTGTYVVSASDPETYAILSFAATNITIRGDDIGASTIQVADSCPTYEWLLGPSADGTDLTGLEIFNLTFDHNIDNNAITDNQETVDWPEYTCGTFVGANINLHDLEVINASSRQNLMVNDDTAAMTNVTIDNIICSGIGDDPNHIVHDSSFIYVHASDFTISNCNLACDSSELPGGITAIETHGTSYTVEDNTIENFQIGMNITGVSESAAEGVLVTRNDISGCYLGIQLWSNQYGEHTTGYGIDGCDVTYNTIDIIVCGGVGDTAARRGISIEYDSDLDVNNLTIDHNTITDTLETVAGGSNNGSYGIGWWSAGSVTLSNSSITNNIVTNFPNAAIRLSGCDLNTVSVTNNTFTDTGSTLVAIPDPYRSPIFVWPVNGDTYDISDNAFVDDIAVTRIPYFMYLGATTTSDDFVIAGNTFNITGDKVVFVKHIEVDGAVSRPTLTGTIADFVPPEGNVKHAVTLIIDGATEWTVDEDEVTWHQT